MRLYLATSLPARQAVEEGHAPGGIGGEGIEDEDARGTAGHQAVDPGQDVLAGAAVHGLQRLVEEDLTGRADAGRGEDRAPALTHRQLADRAPAEAGQAYPLQRLDGALRGLAA